MIFWTREMHYGLHYARVNWCEKISHNWFYAKIQTREIGKAQES